MFKLARRRGLAPWRTSRILRKLGEKFGGNGERDALDRLVAEVLRGVIGAVE